MVTGIGADIIEIDRIRESIERRERFLARVFTEAERAYCSSCGNPAQHYAGRFAAKEAVAKALGSSLSWQDVEILSSGSGKPEVRLYNKAAKVAAGLRVMVSISHCKTYATAYALAVSE